MSRFRFLKVVRWPTLILVLGAISPGAAIAGEFHSEIGTDTAIKASQVGTDVTTVNGGTWKCNEITYSGTQVGATATTIKVVPRFSECSAFGFVNIPIDSQQCTYEFSGDNSNMVIACPATEPLTVTSFNCWVTIPSQTIVGGVTYANTGSGSSRDLDITLNLSGFHYIQHSKSFPGCSNGTRTDGKETGQITLLGFTTGGAQTGVWRE